MTTELTTTTTGGAPGALLHRLAKQAGVSAKDYYDTIMKTVMPSPSAKKEEVMAFLTVADQHGLNPFLKQIYAFPGKGGGIVPMMGYDGWVSLVARQPTHDGTEFVYADDGAWVECSIHHKGKSRPTTVREYLEECKRNTDPWRTMPQRMLRNRAFCQAARLAYGISGVMLDDEVEAWQEREVEAEVYPLQEQTQSRSHERRAETQHIVHVDIRPDPQPEPTEDPEEAEIDRLSKLDNELFGDTADKMTPDYD